MAVELVLKGIKLYGSSKYYSYLEDAKFSLDRKMIFDKVITINRYGNLSLSNESSTNRYLLQKCMSKLMKIGKLTIKRSSKEEIISQNGRKKHLNIKTVQVWNPQEYQFENPTGADSTITEILNPQFIYADLRNEDLQDFSSTKPVGGLIRAITDDFQQQDIYKEFEDAHAHAFGQKGLLSLLEKTQKRINEKLTGQFGEAKVNFSFDLPDVTAFLKKRKYFDY